MIKSFFWVGALGLAVLALGGCESNDDESEHRIDVDEKTFTAVDADNINYSQIMTAESHDYWELREAELFSAIKLVAQGGDLSPAALTDVQRTAVDALDPEQQERPWDIDIGCDEGCWGRYLIVLDGDVAKYQVSLSEFLGDIETLDEAIFYAAGLGYSVQSARFNATDNSYDVLAIKSVSDCLPIQDDRFLIHISADGVLEVLDSEVWERIDGCV